MKRKWLLIGIILLFVGMTITPAMAQEQSDVSPHFKLEFPNQGLYYYVSPFTNMLKDKIPYPSYKLLRQWDAKPFPNKTVMFIGGGVGLLPLYNVTIELSAYDPIYSKVDVFSDGNYYDTLYPKFLGPISVRYYLLFYYEKGFHSLKFVTEDNTSLTLDVQIGWDGFIHNILPYLLKTNIVGKDAI